MSESIWDDPRITAYVLGEMPADELAAFEQMLESDPQLAEAVQEARGVTHQLESLYADEPVQALDADRRHSLTGVNDANPTAPTTTPLPRTEIGTSAPGTRGWKVPLMLLATAAALLLLIGGPQWWAGDKQIGQVDESAPPVRALHNSAEVATDAVVEAEQQVPELPAIANAAGTLSEQGVDRDSFLAPEEESAVQMLGQSFEGDQASAENRIGGQLQEQLTDSFSSSPLPRQAGQKGRTLQRTAPSELADKVADAPTADSKAVVNNRSTVVPNIAVRSEMLADGASRPAPASGSLGGGGHTTLQFSDGSRGSDGKAGGDGSDLAGSVRESARASSDLSVLPARPVTAAPTLSKDPAIRRESPASDLSLSTAKPIEFIPELGTVIVRGRKEDVEKAKKQIADLQNQPGGRAYTIPESQRQLDAIALGNVPPAPAGQAPSASPAPLARVPLAQHTTVLESKLAESYRAKGLQKRDASTATRFARGGQASATPPKPEQMLRRSRGINAGLNDVDFGLPIDEGRGPGIAGDRFDPIEDNAFKRVSEHPLSTFSVDVDTASYSKTRDFLVRQTSLPRPDAVRIEELVNYFDYEYVPPKNDAEHPFATTATLMSCPWNDEHQLARIALKGKTMRKEERPRCNLVFLLDTSGSMNAANKLPLVVEGMKMLIGELGDKDQVAITVYAGSAGLVLDSTAAKKSKKIRRALTELSAGGSTNGGAGIALAYQTARDNFISDGVNRVILCTDGDFNVGTTGTDELVRMVEKEAKGGIFLSVLGFGMGNHNDAMLERISGRGNGNYAFIDTREEARKVLVDQTSGTLVTIAKDVKLQIEFNPNKISSYRLIGYENRVLAKEDFKNDKVDAGEIGAGHAVTALYEIVPAGVEADASSPEVDDLKYQEKPKPTKAADSGESMTLKLRYKEPDGDTSTEIEIPVEDTELEFKDADHDARFAAAVAGFGMQLRRSKYAGDWMLDDVIRVAKDSTGEDEYGIRAEFIRLAEQAKQLMGQE